MTEDITIVPSPYQKLYNMYGARGRMMFSRVLARTLADWNGYFWLRCKLCEEDYAGFESYAGGVVITNEGMYGVCSRPLCKEIGAKQKEAMYRQLRREYGQHDRDLGAGQHRSQQDHLG